MSESKGRSCVQIKAMRSPHQLVHKMDRPFKVCVVSEAEELSSELQVVYEMKRLWKGNPLQTYVREINFIQFVEKVICSCR